MVFLTKHSICIFTFPYTQFFKTSLSIGVLDVTDQGQITRFSIPMAIHNIKNWKDKKLSEFVATVSVYLAFLEAIPETLRSPKKTKAQPSPQYFSNSVQSMVSNNKQIWDFNSHSCSAPKKAMGRCGLHKWHCVSVLLKQEHVTWMQIVHGGKQAKKRGGKG